MPTRKTKVPRRTRKKTARRSTASGRPPRKKPARKKAARARTAAGKPARREVPPTLAEFSRVVRRDLTNLERKIEKAGRAARSRAVPVLRDVSRQLGRLEAEGEKVWRRGADRTRRDAARALHALEHAITEHRSRRGPRNGFESRGSGI